MSSEKKYWLDESRNVDKLVYSLYLACALLLLLDLLYHKHVHFEFEKWFGFFGFYGFIACVGLVLAAKVLRVIVKRDDDYYDSSS